MAATKKRPRRGKSINEAVPPVAGVKERPCLGIVGHEPDTGAVIACREMVTGTASQRICWRCKARQEYEPRFTTHFDRRRKPPASTVSRD